MRFKKKIILLALLILTITGCTNLNSLDLDTLVDTLLEKDSNLTNTVFDGYKYYVPKGLRLIEKNEYNASFKDEYNNTYYLYIDVISYYNKENVDYKDEQKNDEGNGNDEIDSSEDKTILETEQEDKPIQDETERRKQELKESIIAKQQELRELKKELSRVDDELEL